MSLQMAGTKHKAQSLHKPAAYLCSSLGLGTNLVHSRFWKLASIQHRAACNRTALIKGHVCIQSCHTLSLLSVPRQSKTRAGAVFSRSKAQTLRCFQPPTFGTRRILPLPCDISTSGSWAVAVPTIDWCSRNISRTPSASSAAATALADAI
jgi:hypothetical protein